MVRAALKPATKPVGVSSEGDAPPRRASSNGMRVSGFLTCRPQELLRTPPPCRKEQGRPARCTPASIRCCTPSSEGCVAVRGLWALRSAFGEVAAARVLCHHRFTGCCSSRRRGSSGTGRTWQQDPAAAGGEYANTGLGSPTGTLETSKRRRRSSQQQRFLLAALRRIGSSSTASLAAQLLLFCCCARALVPLPQRSCCDGRRYREMLLYTPTSCGSPVKLLSMIFRRDCKAG